MTLTDILSNQLSNVYLDQDDRWRQFIIDHKNYIKLNGQYYTVSAQVMSQCTFDLGRFLRQNALPRYFYWIILCINDISNDQEFTIDMISPGFYVPLETVIQDLYAKYVSMYTQT